MAKLLVHESAGIREFEIVDNEVHMGRELDNTLRLPDPSISRHHCVVRKAAGGYEIQDLQSSNGVLVNGTRVQASPLRNGDRITLGQVQLTFEDPRPESNATVAISRTEAPAPPMGTVRMSAEELAAIHAGKPPAEAAQAKVSTGPVPIVPVAAAPAALPPLPPPIPPVAPPPAPYQQPQAAPGDTGPMPAFLLPYLPPVPDNAQPTGERGDFLTRLLAVLIDAVPMIALNIAAMILSAIPFLGCLIFPLVSLAGLAYGFLFIPYCLIKFGASPGKKLMKLRVVPEDNPRGRIDVNAAILRMVGHFANGILFGLPYLMILGGERKGIQDLISKSICIKVDR
jgi:uncharacterized RDD family membrane protein YckC